MATTESPVAAVARRRLLAVGFTVLGIAGVAALLWLTRSPPQIGADEDVFKTVDALFTAVTARDQRLLDSCERRLTELSATGRLPADASGYLDGVIRKARAGKWEAAAERLYDFMRAQRTENRPPKPSKLPPKKK